MTPADLLDTARYPLEHPERAAYRAAVNLAQDGMRRQGAAELENFLSPAGLALCLQDAEQLSPLAYFGRGLGSAYLESPSESWPAEHPRARRMPFSVGVVAYDQFPAASPLRQLYEWAPLLSFVRDVLGTDQLFPYADPLGALNLAVMGEGDELQWHYDQTDFVVSLALRPAAAGGHFEVAPRLRDADNENYDEVAAVLAGKSLAGKSLAGKSTRVEVLPLVAGTLLLFEGRHSLHRVSPIVGAPTRLIALLGYDKAPDVVSTPQLQQKRYGRELRVPT